MACIIINVAGNKDINLFKAYRVLISGSFRLLILEFLGLKKTTTTTKQLLFHLKAVQNIFVTLLAGSQVSDRCPSGYLFIFLFTCGKVKYLMLDKDIFGWIKLKPDVLYNT